MGKTNMTKLNIYTHEEIYQPLTQEVADKIISQVNNVFNFMLNEMDFTNENIPQPIKSMIDNVNIILSQLDDYGIKPPL